VYVVNVHENSSGNASTCEVEPSTPLSKRMTYLRAVGAGDDYTLRHSTNGG
jgi:hypothetical protein